MNRFGVQHWIACLGSAAVPPVGVNNFYNLFGVGHVHTFAGDVEFPAVIPELNLFARFVNGTGVKRFEVELVWRDGNDAGVRFIAADEKIAASPAAAAPPVAKPLSIMELRRLVAAR